MAASPSTKTVSAHITITRESEPSERDWKIKCGGCARLVSGPIRYLVIGRTGVELCTDCVDELKTAVAADPSQ